MEAGSDRRARLISNEHDWMVDRLRSLEEALDSLFHRGHAADWHGMRIVLRRCRELQNALTQHMPDEEEMYEQFAGDDDMWPLIERLKAEHKVMGDVLSESIGALEAIKHGAAPEEDVRCGGQVVELKDRLRRFCKFMQQHIATENLCVFPRLAA